MKLLLVLGSDETYTDIARSVKPLGFDFIRYDNVIKAMDNIDEIDPQAIIVSARDFPRHWKILAQFVRNGRSKSDCPVIILKGDNFLLEDSTKASFLGVNGIVSETLNNPAENEQLKGILSRYIAVGERRRYHRLQTEPWQRFAFVFVHPLHRVLITGEIKNLSVGAIAFLPDSSSQMKDMALSMELNDCSLRAGDALLSPICRLARTGRIISLEFTSFPGEEQKNLNDYIEGLPLQKLRETGKTSD